MQEKVLVLDIDGTLTNSKKEITEATKQGIWNILQHGHKVILASGRPTPGMRKCEEELELKKYGGYLLSFNGARIVECSHILQFIQHISYLRAQIIIYLQPFCFIC